ncbi:DNA-3-methyladenine glycosylase I [Liquorilactobacillus capillatus]|nr:DNA-3-methyladenine glycosylase I [Liquorilactobacillus capillatus]
MVQRCAWANTGGQLLRDYHDHEWGKKVKDERLIFELLSLEIMQAGLNWELVLKKREAFKVAFDNFEITKVAAYDAAKVEELCQNPAIIRNKRKIRAIITNAQAITTLHLAGTTLNKLLWQLADNRTVINNWEHAEQVPAKTLFSKRVALELQQKGFKFVGPTIVYSFLQAVGIINDHLSYCSFKY